MKKVLILCHDFPPLNSVAAQRPLSWYNHLHEFGYYPIVVCRKWKEGIKNINDKYMSDNQKIVTSSDERGEIHRIPVKLNRRDEFIAKNGFEKKVLQRKILSVLEMIKALLNPSIGEHSYLFEYCESYLTKNDVNVIIVSGGPFDLFKYASRLSNKYKTPWIADYRDEWMNNRSLSNLSFLKRKIHSWLSGNEVKWTKNCEAFTSVSFPLINRIESKIGKKGYLVRNGIELKDVPTTKQTSDEKFVLTYAGTVYDSKYVELFIGGLKSFLKNESPGTSFELNFIGIDLNQTEGTLRLKKELNEIEVKVDYLPSMPYNELLKSLSTSTACLNMVYTSIADGIYAVKIFDYMVLKKPIINIEVVKPENDHEFSEYMEDCYSVQEVSEVLSSFYNNWKKGDLKPSSIPDSVLKEFDRSFQCGKLAEVLDKIT